MKNNHELVAKLNNDVNKLQNKIEHRNLYNVRNFVVQALLKSGIAIDYALPFILAAITFANSQASKGKTPFHIECTSHPSLSFHLCFSAFAFTVGLTPIQY